MKEYISKRLEELREEKEMWLDKLQYNEDEDARLYYLECIARINELLDLQAELEKSEVNEEVK